MLGLDNLVNSLTGFIETRIELLKLDAQEKLSALIEGFIKLAIKLFLGFLFIIFLGFSFSYFIGHLIGNVAIGFSITTLLLLILLTLIQKGAFDKLFKNEINNNLNQLFGDNKNGNDE